MNLTTSKKMKKILYIFILISTIISCKKIDFNKFHFTTNEITETDTLGNLVGHIQTGDWTLKPISAGDGFDKKVFADFQKIVNEVKNAGAPEYAPFDFNLYNQNCNLDTFTFKIVAYPNPTVSHTIQSPWGPSPVPSCGLNLNIQTNLKIARSIMFYSNKIDAKGKVHYLYSDSTIATALLATPIAERDYILYYIIYTTDGCVFFCKGNVMGCKAI